MKKKGRVPFPWPALCFVSVAAVEACYGKWEVVRIILALTGLFLVLWLPLGLLNAKKGSEAPTAGGLAPLWRGDWIRTEDPKKKKAILLTARLALPALFLGFAARMMLSGGMDTENTLMLAAFLLSALLGASAEIVRDFREEMKSPPRAPTAAPPPLSAAEKRLRQIDEWLEIGLIDRAEHRRLREQAEKGAEHEKEQAEE